MMRSRSAAVSTRNYYGLAKKKKMLFLSVVMRNYNIKSSLKRSTLIYKLHCPWVSIAKQLQMKAG